MGFKMCSFQKTIFVLTLFFISINCQQQAQQHQQQNQQQYQQQQQPPPQQAQHQPQPGMHQQQAQHQPQMQQQAQHPPQAEQQQQPHTQQQQGQPHQNQPQPGMQQQQQAQQGQPQPGHRFASENEIQDESHIKSHLADEINIDESKMTSEQLQFHYFTMHDQNKDNMLDGLELLKAITHWHGAADGAPPPPRLDDNELEDMIDTILKDDDFNNDGFVDYGEFLKAQTGRT